MRSDAGNARQGWKRNLKSKRRLFETAAVILVIIAACVVFGFNGKNDTISIDEAKESPKETEAAAEKKTSSSSREVTVYVDVEGEVNKPGVYELSKDARIFEAVKKAGGLTRHADTRTINQAEKVKDGQLIVIPKKGQGGAAAGNGQTAGESSGSGGSVSSGSAASGTASGQGLININTAGSEELQKIPGVGPATARKIIDYRNQNGNFPDKASLKNVSGIGDKTYAKMENLITV